MPRKPKVQTELPKPPTPEVPAEPLAMTPEREAAFEKAKKASDDLMRALYEIRGRFQPGEAERVWLYIPAAQSLLNQVNDRIEKARAWVVSGGKQSYL